MLARASLLACLLPLTAAAQQTIAVPAFTLVPLRMMEPLSSDRLHRGYRFRFVVAEDVLVDGAVVIPAGSRGEGEVIHAEDSGGRNHPGELVLAARFVTVGDVEVKLRSFVAGSADRDNDALAVPKFDRASGGGRGDDAHLGKNGMATARTSGAVRLPAAEPGEQPYGSSLPESASAFTGDDSGYGTVVFFRERTASSDNVEAQIRDGGKPQAVLLNGTYVELRLPAGIHEFGTFNKSDGDIRLEVDSGESYFVACARGARSSVRLNCAPSNRRIFDLTKPTLRKAT